MKLAIKCKTPKGKVKSTLKRFKRYFVNFTLIKKPKAKILDDHTFELVFTDITEKQRQKLIKKAHLAEIGIKYFYKVLMKLGNRANKVGSKVGNVKKWFIKQFKKKYSEQDAKQFEEMSDEDFKELLNFDDRDEMVEFLKTELIEIEDRD